jgi:cytidine deaminase
MREFCDDDFLIYIVGSGDSYEVMTLAELLPHSFSAKAHMR